jgi:hypothetical protein
MVHVVKLVIIVYQIHGNKSFEWIVIFLIIVFSSYNGGSCVATTTGYLCQCSYPFTGSNCEAAVTPAPRPVCACIICPCPTPVVNVINPCLPNPCQNNGGCAVFQQVARCYCPTSYTGYYCQFGKFNFEFLFMKFFLIEISP